MLDRLKRFIAAPVFPEDEEKTRMSRLLNPILLNLIWVLALIALAILFIFPERFLSIILALFTLFWILLSRYLMGQGKVRLACQLFIGGSGIDITLIVLFSGGMTSIHNVLYIALVVMAALLLGRRAALYLAFSVILASLVMVILDAAHAMPPRIFPVPPRSGWFMLTVALGLATVTLNIALKSLYEAGACSQKELAERKIVEAALAESEQRFHTIYDSVNDAIFVHDIQSGAILDVNQRMCEMYGYTRAEALQLSIEDLSQGEPPYTQRDAMGLFRQIAPEESRIAEWYAKDKNGLLFWVEVNLRHTTIGNQERMLVTARNINERKKADQRRIALYRISDAARATQDLGDFCQLIHAVIRTLMPARNFYIALYDSATDMLSYPYFSDEHDQTPLPHPVDKSLTAYVQRNGSPLLATPEIYQKLESEGAVESVGTPSVDWLGSPLRTTRGVIGVLAVQTYTPAERLSMEDQEVLEFVSNQVAMMLERKQAEEHDRVFSHGLRAVIEAADELIRCDQLDTLYRRAVELAREKIGLERVGLFVLDPDDKNLIGTYGTDDRGQTTDEHAAFEPASNHPYLFNLTDRLWYVRTTTRAYWQGEEAHTLQEGWVAGTVIHSLKQPIGIIFNDSAITKSPLNEAVQETLAVYCSLLGNIIDRKRLEERERNRARQLHAVVECADELISCENLDTLYRRAVELAREKIGVERIGLFLLEPEGKYLVGTYGTDDHGRTTDEHSNRDPLDAHPNLFAASDRLWYVQEQPLTYWDGQHPLQVSKGWAAGTVIRSLTHPVGALFNDTAISHKPLDESTQETLVIYGSLLGNIIERKRSEEREREMVHRLHAVVEATDELIGLENLDTFYRRAIELAREKLNVERCAIFLIDGKREYLVGTYGTDSKGQTVDEHDVKWQANDPPELFAGGGQNRLVRQEDMHSYWENGVQIIVDRGWVGFTLIRIGNEPIGVFCNDCAISHSSPSETVQDTISVYCSVLGNIIERKRSEEHERDMARRLHAVVDITDELIGCESLDMFYRRAVELAREKLNVERCSIFLLDETHEYLHGTYGTNNQRQTSDEHIVKFPSKDVPDLFDSTVPKYALHENVNPVYYKNGNGNALLLNPGWVASTIIRIANEPIGVFYNDSGISQAPHDETTQETIAIYCSLLGNIIKRMHVEAEQKRLIAELEAKNSELERFAYTVSHDLKSPLITIRGFLGFLEKDAVAGNLERFRTDIGRISDATNKMQQLLNGLLELSRVGRLMNPGESVPFEDIAREAQALVQGQIEALGAEVTIQSGLPSVFGDRSRLVEVVQNLLDNAVKFSNQQLSPRIEIGTRGADETGKPIFYVRDNGMGIDPQYHERIFGLFNKLDAQSEGTGIGLALVKRIIEIHGGRIWVESEGKGKGSTFFFSLPITESSEPG